MSERLIIYFTLGEPRAPGARRCRLIVRKPEHPGEDEFVEVFAKDRLGRDAWKSLDDCRAEINHDHLIRRALHAAFDGTMLLRAVRGLAKDGIVKTDDGFEIDVGRY